MSVSFNQVDDLPDEKCGICWDELKSDVWAHDGHSFHGRCITQAVNVNPRCPLCREVVDNTTLVARDRLLKQDVRISNKAITASTVAASSCFLMGMYFDNPWFHYVGFAILAVRVWLDERTQTINERIAR